MHVLKYCSGNNINVREFLIRPGDISEMSGCFITGTSPMVLPVFSLDDHLFDVTHSLLRKIMEEWWHH